MPLDHFFFVVPPSKFDALVTFFTISLAPIGFKEFVRPVPHVVGLGESSPYLWLNGNMPEDADEKSIAAVLGKSHLAFTAENSEQVKQFYAAALEAGATDNGPPGLRPNIHPGYYGAFVRDPACGMNIEMVCHKGE